MVNSMEWEGEEGKEHIISKQAAPGSRRRFCAVRYAGNSQ
jgi:hypothetical protein